MKYLKLFNEHSGYTEFTHTEDFLIPNVSHCIVQEDVHYNPVIDWIDPEFKRICLENFNGGREMTYYDLVSVTQERWDQVVYPNGTSIFKNNTEIHSIADMEKFINVHTLGFATFSALTGVAGDLVIPSNITTVKGRVFSNMSNVTNIVIGHEINWAPPAGDNWGPQTFGALSRVNGVVDLRNFKTIGEYHEFDGLGSAGSGCQVIMPALQQRFGVWFASSKISAMAGSEEELVNGTIKIPEGYTYGGQLAFNSCPNVLRVICPESMTTFETFCGGDGSWNNVRYFEIGSNTTLLKGGVCGANGWNHQTTVVCKAVTPPRIEQGGYGHGGNTDYLYPFIDTKVKALYVPDESIDLYKNSSTTAATAPDEYCYYERMVENVEIGWKRFADVIHPLSELS